MRHWFHCLLPLLALPTHLLTYLLTFDLCVFTPIMIPHHTNCIPPLPSSLPPPPPNSSLPHPSPSLLNTLYLPLLQNLESSCPNNLLLPRIINGKPRAFCRFMLTNILLILPCSTYCFIGINKPPGFIPHMLQHCLNMYHVLYYGK